MWNNKMLAVQRIFRRVGTVKILLSYEFRKRFVYLEYNRNEEQYNRSDL